MSSNYENAAAVNTHSGQYLPGTLSGGEALSPSATLDPGGGVISAFDQRAARNGGRGREKRPTSDRRRAASQANGRKSQGPVTVAGKARSSQNARKPGERLLGLTEARTLHHQPGAALRLYRKLIAPYQPAPALLAQHFQDLARLYLELEAWECIRDAVVDHRAQQNTIEVRSSYREMDSELDVAPKEVFERGLYDLPDSPAKLKAQMECLTMLKNHLAQGQFENIGPALRKLYGRELNPKSEEAKLVCIDCQRLMDSQDSEPLNDQEFHDLLFVLEQEEQRAMDGYELELDKRTVTGAACVSRLAPRHQDQWMYLQGQRLRQAIDRKQWVITGLRQTPMLAQRYGPNASGTGVPAAQDPPPPRYSPKSKTNLRSVLESTKRRKNEPKTNLNKPKRT